MTPFVFHHVDVFSARPFSGNSLAVFPDSDGLDGLQMSAITKELRHFESIFIDSTADDRVVHARVFDLMEELDFAGHPVLGAACVLHALRGTREAEQWTIHLKARTVHVRTRRHDAHFQADLDQGHAEFLGTVGPQYDGRIAAALGIRTTQFDARFRPEVISTGLRYLVVPVTTDGLEDASIVDASFVPLLEELGAQFVYVLDAAGMEGRHWNHIGGLEDVATGSGAGCVAAFLRRHALIADGISVTLRQGRFTGRPSELQLTAFGEGMDIRSVRVAGDVSFVGVGQLQVLPEKGERA